MTRLKSCLAAWAALFALGGGAQAVDLDPFFETDQDISQGMVVGTDLSIRSRVSSDASPVCNASLPPSCPGGQNYYDVPGPIEVLLSPQGQDSGSSKVEAVQVGSSDLAAGNVLIGEDGVVPLAETQPLSVQKRERSIGCIIDTLSLDNSNVSTLFNPSCQFRDSFQPERRNRKQDEGIGMSSDSYINILTPEGERAAINVLSTEGEPAAP